MEWNGMECMCRCAMGCFHIETEDWNLPLDRDKCVSKHVDLYTSKITVGNILLIFAVPGGRGRVDVTLQVLVDIKKLMTTAILDGRLHCISL